MCVCVCVSVCVYSKIIDNMCFVQASVCVCAIIIGSEQIFLQVSLIVVCGDCLSYTRTWMEKILGLVKLVSYYKSEFLL